MRKKAISLSICLALSVFVCIAFGGPVTSVYTGNGSSATSPIASALVHGLIKSLAETEGDINLVWDTSKANIKTIRIFTSSTDWDLYLLQNDNGFVADDANVPKMKLGSNISGDGDLVIDLAYEDEDGSKEVHLYWLDNSGANTADIYITGYKAI